MTLEEVVAREAIRDVMARCNQAGDLCDGDAYAACFTLDGVLLSERDDGGINMRCEGHDDIRAWQAGKVVNGRSKPKFKFAQHCIATSRVVIESASTASARTYWHVITEVGPDHAGIYHDEFQKVGEEWLFKTRRVHMRWHADNSVFVTAGAKGLNP